MTKVLTPEHLAKLAAGRAARSQRKKESTLRSDFASEDQRLWEDLARKYKVRLPHWNTPTTMKTLHDFFKKLRIDSAHFLDFHADKNLTTFIKRNPSWPARAIAGLMLEYKENGCESW